MSAIHAKAAIRELGTKAQAVVDDPHLTNVQKMARLDTYSAELKQYQDEIAVDEGAKALMVGGEALSNSAGWTQFGSKAAMNRAPSLSFSRDESQALWNAVRTKSSLRMEVVTKAPSDVAGLLPPQLLPGIVAFRYEPVRILNRIPNAPMEAPSVEFITHTATVGTAGVVAKGGLKPEFEMTPSQTILTATKIAAWTSTFDEDLQDFPTFSVYLEQELLRLIIDVENAQILNGDGTGTNILGLLKWPGIQTRDHAADVTADANATGLDSLEEAITQLRTGPAYIDADTIVMNPTTWSKLRRIKNSLGAYILNPDPASAEANSAWGIPVLTTTTCPVGTALVGNLSMAAQAFVRKGFVVEVSNQAGTAFTTNTVLIRGEERLTVGVAYPKALVAVSNL